MSSSDMIDVVIIGSGPAGLAAATRLKKAGVDKVVVLERNADPGGAPRHCGHPAFGMLEHKRVETGPSYARRLVQQAVEIGVEIRPYYSVVKMEAGCRLTVAHPRGPVEVHAKKVIIATGTRETPRSARLVSGGRFAGICTTGTLQNMVYLHGITPFKRPVIVGAEPVAYSALLTCKKAGVRPVAMVKEGEHRLAWPLCNISRLFDIELTSGVQAMRIAGEQDRVASVHVDLKGGETEEFKCDGVLFTGRFTPESALVKMSHLAVDSLSGSPLTDHYGRCSDPDYYAAGNLLAPAKMAVSCWRGGRKTADHILLDLAGRLPGARPEAFQGG